MNWPHFARFLLASAALIALGLYAFILVLDPYQNVPFAPSLARAPVSQNQRFAYPALARNPAFDGLIIGTSTARLLDPARLGALLGARMLNLAMNSATAHEQTLLYELFRRHHPSARYLVIGLDETWCNRDERIAQFTFRQFPAWMYDDDPWNDLLYLFNDKALEDAVRMLELLAGGRAPKYQSDGYSDFTREFADYDAARVATRLHRGRREPYANVPVMPSDRHPQWRYPLLEGLVDIVESMPAASTVALVFMPLHGRYIARIAANMSECKGRMVAALAATHNVTLLDYLYGSELTRTDANYWDPVHYTNTVARLLEADLALALVLRPPVSGYARVLVAPTAADPPAR